MEARNAIDADVLLRLESPRMGQDLDVWRGERVGWWEDQAGVVDSCEYCSMKTQRDEQERIR
jgi:hypothetical protein